MSEQTPAAVAARPVVYAPAGTAEVRVEAASFAATSGRKLPIDIYRPAAESAVPRPVVVLATGYRDEGMRRVFGCPAREMGAFRSWARLFAAAGLAAVTYENESPASDAHMVLRHVRSDAPSLGVDASRIGLWACSGHAPTALACLLDDSALQCGVFLYPYLLDAGEGTEVAAAASTFGFATPAAGRAVAALPVDRPLLVVRAGGDEMPGLNASLDRVIADALRTDRPLTVLNHAAASHAFDLTDDTAATHRVIQGVVQFMTTQLNHAVSSF